jgi:hypothetical protein
VTGSDVVDRHPGWTHIGVLVSLAGTTALVGMKDEKRAILPYVGAVVIEAGVSLLAQALVQHAEREIGAGGGVERAYRRSDAAGKHVLVR